MSTQPNNLWSQRPTTRGSPNSPKHASKRVAISFMLVCSFISDQHYPLSPILMRLPWGAGNIVWHDRKRRRCKCKRCGHTFSDRRGTLFYGLRPHEQMVLWVVTLVAH